MRQVYIDNDRIVREVIPEFDPIFPGVPISARYSPEFLSRCLEIPDVVEVAPSMEYLPVQNAFVWPLRYTGVNAATAGEEAIIVPVSFSEAGEWKIADSTVNGAQAVDGGLSIPERETGSVRVRFCEAQFGREMEVEIQIVPPVETEIPDDPGPDAEAPELEPAPTTAEILDALLGVSGNE